MDIDNFGQLIRRHPSGWRYAVYFGSFDPFHDGHREAIEVVSSRVNMVVVSAVRKNRLKPWLSAYQHRIKLIEQHLDYVSPLLRRTNRVVIVDGALDHILLALRGKRVVGVMGSDVLERFRQQRRKPRLAVNEWYVIPRVGISLTSSFVGFKCEVLDPELFSKQNTSSTAIRELLAESKHTIPVRLCPATYRYIKKHHLYERKEKPALRFMAGDERKAIGDVARYWGCSEKSLSASRLVGKSDHIVFLVSQKGSSMAGVAPNSSMALAGTNTGVAPNSSSNFSVALAGTNTGVVKQVDPNADSGNQIVIKIFKIKEEGDKEVAAYRFLRDHKFRVPKIYDIMADSSAVSVILEYISGRVARDALDDLTTARKLGMLLARLHSLSSCLAGTTHCERKSMKSMKSKKSKERNTPFSDDYWRHPGKPCFVLGDANLGNFIVTAEDIVMIDPGSLMLSIASGSIPPRPVGCAAADHAQIMCDMMMTAPSPCFLQAFVDGYGESPLFTREAWTHFAFHYHRMYSRHKSDVYWACAREWLKLSFPLPFCLFTFHLISEYLREINV